MLVEFIFDYPSPYAYLASTQLGRLGVPVRYEPVGTTDVMSRSGRSASSGGVCSRERATPRGPVTRVVALQEWLSPVP